MVRLLLALGPLLYLVTLVSHKAFLIFPRVVQGKRNLVLEFFGGFFACLLVLFLLLLLFH